jgi:CheY-like chemotaxis protein
MVAASLAGIHALIVDNDLMQAQALGNLLSDEAIDCTMVGSGVEALAISATLRPDVAILDLVMPHMNGLELLHCLRQRLPTLPAILTTGWPYDQRVAAFLEQGATAYLTKPLDVGDLLQIVARLTGSARLPRPDGV